MRNKFDMQLEKLNCDLIEMGAMCEKAIDDAVIALRKSDKVLAKKVMESDKAVDEKEREIENLCLKLVLQQQPVARDLRAISSALKMITDMERIGDQAADIAEITYFTDLKDNIGKINISKMSEETCKMVNQSIEAFVKKDLDLALKVMKYDDKVDELFLKIKKEVTEFLIKNTEHVQDAVDLLMIAKYLERIGDHAENIAEWVEFAITGKHRDEF